MMALTNFTVKFTDRRGETWTMPPFATWAKFEDYLIEKISIIQDYEILD